MSILQNTKSGFTYLLKLLLCGLAARKGIRLTPKDIGKTAHKCVPVIILCLGMASCGKAPTISEDPATQQKEPSKLIQAWAQVIAETNAINKQAFQYALEHNLPVGADLPPKLFKFRRSNPELTPGEEPLDLAYEFDEHPQTALFWIHIGNKVPHEGEPYAFAIMVDTQTKQEAHFPKTKETLALKEQVLTTLREKNP